MHTALVTTAIVLCATAFVAGIVWLVRWDAERQRAIESAWRAHAARRQLTWVGSSGPWYRHIGYHMSGDIGGVRATFDQYTVRRGKSSVHYTRVSSDLQRAVPERLIICRKTLTNRLNFAFQGPLLELDDMRSTDKLLVRCRSESFARSVVDERLRSALYALPPRTHVECIDRQAKVCWRGTERNPAVLDQAAALLVGVVRALVKP
jgi:hypothetical protein